MICRMDIRAGGSIFTTLSGVVNYIPRSLITQSCIGEWGRVGGGGGAGWLHWLNQALF